MFKLAYRCSQFLKKVPIVDFEPFLNRKNSINQCQTIKDSFYQYSCVIVKDPRVSEQKNEKFLDLLERYFSKRQSQLDNGEKLNKLDVYPEKQYEVGFTPPFILQAQDHQDMTQHFTGQNGILTPFPSKPLSKMRFLWNIGPISPDVHQNVIPADFPEFEQILNDWGTCMLNAITTTSQMLAISLGLPQNIIADKLTGGANKLAPNGNDLRRCEKGQPFTGIHYDFSFMTIHGRSRFPGLYIWLPNGEKLKIKMPKGHLFIQAGSELEYITGGAIRSGFHEAINTPQVQQRLSEALKEGRSPWRTTSTMFTHLRGDVMLEPLSIFANNETLKKYPPMKQSEVMMKEIGYIRAKKS